MFMWLLVYFIYCGKCKYQAGYIYWLMLITLCFNIVINVFFMLYFIAGKGKKEDDWSDVDSDIELKEVSEDEIAKPVSKKKSKLSSN